MTFDWLRASNLLRARIHRMNIASVMGFVLASSWAVFSSASAFANEVQQGEIEQAIQKPSLKPTGPIIVWTTPELMEVFPVGRRVTYEDEFCLTEEYSSLWIITNGGTQIFNGIGCSRLEEKPAKRVIFSQLVSNRLTSRARVGATRGSRGEKGVRPSNRPQQMIVVRGSDMALAYYPRGRRANVSGRICLPRNAGSVTFQRSGGGLVTFGGGCNNEIKDAPKSRDVSGGTGNGF